MKHTYSSWLARPLAALGLLLATTGAAQAQTPASFAPVVLPLAAQAQVGSTVAVNRQMLTSTPRPGNTAGSGANPRPAGPAMPTGAQRTLATPGTFGPRTDYGVGSAPANTAIGDVNGDGRADLVAANYTSVSVLLGLAGGGFGPKTDYPTATGPLGIALRDLNGDSRLDIVTGNYYSDNVSVLLGQAGGTFGTRTDYATGAGPADLALADVNGDGRLDIVTANQNSSNVSVLLGQVGGTFGAKTDYPAGAGADGVALADLNGDGRLDLVTANYGSASVSVLLGLASGGFGTKTDYPAGSTPTTVALGDVNGDGRLDIVTANQNSNNVSVLLGQVGGTFGTKTDYAIGAGPYGLALGDVNSDGRLDVVTSNTFSYNVSVLLGQAGGGLVAAVNYSTDATPNKVTLGDVNGDRRLDIVTANYTRANVSVLLGLAGTPVLSTFTPSSGLPGSTFAIAGTELGGATAITFRPASGTATTVSSGFVVASNTSITGVPVPAGLAVGPYTVTVTGPGGISNGLTFTVTTAPTVTTTTPSSITSTSAVLGGNATADGGASISDRGVVYSVSSSNAAPTLGGTGVTANSNASGRGNFFETISGLAPGTTYTVRAYATNSVGTSYGSPVSFTTAASVATVTTNIPVNITGTSAVLGGSVTADGGATVTDRGVVYVLGTGTPTTSDTKVQIGTGTGTFSQAITGLRGNTTYTVRAYALNSAGTAYGAAQTFTTPNNPPTAVNDAVTVAEDSGPTVVSVLANDTSAPDIETLTVTAVTQPANGTVTLSGGVVSFTPALHFNGSTSFTYTLSDGNGGTATAPVTVTVTPVNDAPVVTTTAGATTFTPGAGAVAVDNGLTVTDVDNLTLASATVSLTAGLQSGQDGLSFFNTSATTFGNVGTAQSANGTLTLTSAGATTTVAQWQAALRAVTFNNTVAGTSTATRTVAFVVNDGSLNSAPATKSVTFAATTTLVAIVRNGTSPTNAATVTYTVTFASAVTGVSPSNFTVISTNLTGASVTAVSGAGTTYTVTVNTGTLSPGTTGSVQLQFNNSAGISPIVTNPGLTGPAYIIDREGPTTTISSSAGSSTSTSPIPFTVTFSESVTGFAASGVSVTNGTLTSGSLLGSGSGPYTFSVTPTGNGTVTVSVAANAAQDAAGNGNVASNGVSVSYTAPTTLLTWNGSLSQDWNTAANWTPNQVPTASIDVLIPGTGVRFYPLVPATGAATRHLTLTGPGTLTQSAGTLTVNGTLSSSGAITKSAGTIAVTGNLTNTGTLTQSAGDLTVGGSLSNNGPINQSAGTLAVSGNLTNNALFTTGAGTVVLGSATGTTTAAILGSSAIRFWNLTIQASGAQLSTSAGASVRRVLTLTGNFTTQGNLLTIESNTSTGDGLVVNSGGVVIGNATVQRAIDPTLNAGPGYRHYSAPVSNTTVADLSTTTGFAPVVNPAYNTSATPYAVQPFPTVYGYDDIRLVTATNNIMGLDKGYFSPAALSDPLVVGRGYTVNIAASQTVDFVGALTNGDVPLSLTSTRPTNADGGWQLLGNPYPAPLNYALITATDKVNLEGAIYIFSSTSQYAGQYRTSVNGVGGTGILPMGQAFFARVTAGFSSGAITFRNSQRLTAPSTTTFQRPAETRPLVQLTLQNQAGTLADEAYVYFEAGAMAGVEPSYDAVKLANSTGLNLATTAAGQQLSINGQPLLNSASLTVPLTVRVPATGSYTLNAEQLLNLAGTDVYLRDLQLATLTDLHQQPRYSFSLNALNTTPRFELVFGAQRVLSTAAVTLAQQVALYPNPAKNAVSLALPASLSRQALTATLLDALGRPVRTTTLPAQGTAAHQLSLSGLASGVYSLQLRTEAGLVVKRLVID